MYVYGRSGHVKQMDDIPTLKASVTHCFLVLGSKHIVLVVLFHSQSAY